MIYLDNSATSLRKPEPVIAAVVQAMQSMGNSARGVNECSLSASRVIFDTRQALADLFGCPKAELVAFTANSTEALNTAINGLVNKGDHVITTDLEHNSVLRPLYRLEALGFISLSVVPADKLGRVNYADFEALLRTETRAVITTHASNLTGNLLDIGRIGAFCKKHNLTYIVDASQTAGSLPIHMEQMGIDILCFTGHKSLMAPMGTGGICLRPRVELRPWKVGGTGVQTHLKTQPQEYPVRLEAGTLNAHGIAGLLAAVNYINEQSIAAIHSHEIALMQRFYSAVKEIDGVEIYGDFSADRAPIVALNIRDYDSSQVADELSQVYDIAVRAGAHCAPRMHQALGTAQRGAVRFSFGWFNTEAEIEAAIAAVRSIAE